jgi:hypothetical protein
MTRTLTNAHNRNDRTLVRMRQEQEEWRQQARLQKMAISDQAFQKAANSVSLAQRQPWWWPRPFREAHIKRGVAVQGQGFAK